MDRALARADQVPFHDHAPDSGKLSAAKVSLFRRIATLKIQLKQIEATMAFQAVAM
jgi:hypothetical protein